VVKRLERKAVLLAMVRYPQEANTAVGAVKHWPLQRKFKKPEKGSETRMMKVPLTLPVERFAVTATALE
jgi:hypothetical protein